MTSCNSYLKIPAKKRIITAKNKSKEIFERAQFVAIVDKELPKIIYAFCAYEIHGKGNKLMLHFCYTKDSFRNIGFMEMLLLFIEQGKNKFTWSAPTAKPRTFHLFKRYKMERLL